jgi:hypothetical protein
MAMKVFVLFPITDQLFLRSRCCLLQSHPDIGLCDCQEYCKGRTKRLTGRLFIEHFKAHNLPGRIKHLLRACDPSSNPMDSQMPPTGTPYHAAVGPTPGASSSGMDVDVLSVDVGIGATVSADQDSVMDDVDVNLGVSGEEYDLFEVDAVHTDVTSDSLDERGDSGSQRESDSDDEDDSMRTEVGAGLVNSVVNSTVGDSANAGTGGTNATPSPVAPNQSTLQTGRFGNRRSPSQVEVMAAINSTSSADGVATEDLLDAWPSQRDASKLVKTHVQHPVLYIAGTLPLIVIALML